MQEHPVPQNVTGYEFHLIGQMTLKQFFTAGAGVLFAIIVNATNLPEIFKYPLMLLFGLGGFALAFVPYEGRSLDRWFFAFIKSIYQPTLFFWKKTTPVPGAFTYAQPKFIDTTPTVDTSGMRSRRVSEFLQTIPSQKTSATVKEPEEDLDRILALFNQTPAATTTPRAQKISITTTAPSIPTYTAPQISIPKPKEAMVPVFQKERSDVAIKQVGGPIKVEKQEIVAPPLTPLPALKAQEITSVTQKRVAPQDLAPVVRSANLPFPKPPTKPNMLVGMAFTKDNKIIDNAIVEIVRRSDNSVVRALKTNALGQFAIVTPLENAEYEIVVEKPGLTFDKTLLVLNNEVVQPLLIQAK